MIGKFKGRIGVVGAGALGALYGARMARAGYNVSFLLRSDYEAVCQHGLQVRSYQGDFTLDKPDVFSSALEMGRCDLVFIALKATQNGILPTVLPPLCGPKTIFLTLQNGLGNEEAIANVLRTIYPGENVDHRILGGVAFLCSNRLAPGIVDHQSHGHVRLAEFSGPSTSRTQQIAQIFTDADFPVELSESLGQVRWEKLVWNTPFNCLGVAACKGDTEVVLSDDALSGATRGLMEEVVVAAKSDQVEIASAFIDKMFTLTKQMAAYKSSMQIDYEYGRPLEVEAIIGEPLRRARRAGIDTPRMELLYGIVHRLDQLKQLETAPPGEHHYESVRFD
jgi:2-dehydropantoate 2-reductase